MRNTVQAHLPLESEQYSCKTHLRPQQLLWVPFSCFGGGQIKVFMMVYYAGLYESDAAVLPDIFPQYPISWWSKKTVGSYKKTREELGTFVCQRCMIRKKHVLDFRKEAYFQWTSRGGKVLYVWNQEAALELKNYLCTGIRKKDFGKYFIFDNLPGEFKKKGERDFLCKKITQSLMEY